MRNIPDKTDSVGDVLPATDFNAEKNELQNTVNSTGQTLDPTGGPDTDLNQLSKAIAAYANAGATYTDSGAADAYVLSIATNLKTVPAYADNMTVTFKVGATNTGASTVNVNTLGVKDIVDSNGDPLTAGMIIEDDIITLTYNLATGDFELGNNLARPDYVRVEHHTAWNVAGGAMSAGADARDTAPLGTIASDDAGIASLLSNQITLEPGKYKFSCMCQTGGGIGDTKLYLYDTTGAADLVESVKVIGGANWPNSYLEGEFEITVQSVLELQVWHGGAGATTEDFGRNTGSTATSGDNLWRDLQFMRIEK